MKYITSFFYNTYDQEIQNAIVAPALDDQKNILALMVFCIDPKSFILSSKKINQVDTAP